MGQKHIETLLSQLETGHAQFDARAATLVAALNDLSENTSADEAMQVLERLRDYFVTKFLPEFEERRREVFPSFEDCLPSYCAELAALCDEHERLRESFECFKGELTLCRFAAGAAEDRARLDLAALGRQLWSDMLTYADRETALVEQLKNALAHGR